MLDLDLGVTGSVLDALAARTKVVLHNLANQNTPGYKSYRVQFEDLLRDAQAAGKSPGDVQPRIYRDTSGQPGANNVSVMDELAVLNKVSLLNDVFTRRAAGYFNHLNKAIKGQ